jgi:hypothetical protein
MTWSGDGIAGDTDAGGAEEMVTVERFESPTEAQMAKGMLESAGVACFLAGENVNSLMSGVLTVQLQVKAEDEGAAREMLAGAERGDVSGVE